MKILRRSSLAEVLAAWLRAELGSPRFSHHLRLGDVDRRIIEDPDLSDPAENALRRDLLCYRNDILTTIPDDTEWWEAELGAEDLAGLLAINYPAWEISSGGTGRLVQVAAAVREGLQLTADDPLVRGGLAAIREHVRGIYGALTAGKTMGSLVLLGRKREGPFTVIEGNKRAAALGWCHCLDGAPWPGVSALVGITSGPNVWLSPHAAP